MDGALQVIAHNKTLDQFILACVMANCVVLVLDSDANTSSAPAMTSNPIRALRCAGIALEYMTTFVNSVEMPNI